MSYPVIPEPEQKYPEDEQEAAQRAVEATTGSTEIRISTNEHGDAVFTITK